MQLPPRILSRKSPLDLGDAGLEGRDDLFIRETVGGVEQDAGARHFARRVLTALDELEQLLALVSR